MCSPRAAGARLLLGFRDPEKYLYTCRRPSAEAACGGGHGNYLPRSQVQTSSHCCCGSDAGCERQRRVQWRRALRTVSRRECVVRGRFSRSGSPRLRWPTGARRPSLSVWVRRKLPRWRGECGRTFCLWGATNQASGKPQVHLSLYLHGGLMLYVTRTGCYSTH